MQEQEEYEQLRAITTIVEDAPLELAISLWLHSKFQHTHSDRTRRAYQETLTQFRSGLQRAGLDLDGDPQHVADLAQAFASFSRSGKQLARSTFNLRLAILSSFYAHAIKRGVLQANPIDTIERTNVEAYASAKPLPHDSTRAALAMIDRDTLQGKRDYALLRLFLQTGRRLSEIANLTRGDLDGALITFPRCKGGKVMSDTLPASVLSAMHTWLRCYYGPSWEELPAHTPLWVSLSRQNHGAALGTQTIGNLCQKHLGTSNIHKLRHTFARDMKASGAKESEIQARLGHSSLATTGIYLAKLKRAENAYAEQIAALYDD